MSKFKRTFNPILASACLMMFLIVSSESFARGRGPDGLERLPRGCMQEGYAFQYRMLYLHPPEAGNNDSVYFIFNDSYKDITLRAMSDKNKPNITLFNNRIRAKQWGVFSSDMPRVRFACTVKSDKFAYGNVVDCQKHLKVCEFSDVLYGQNNRGNYWMVGSTTRNSAVRRAIRYGVLLSRGHY